LDILYFNRDAGNFSNGVDTITTKKIDFLNKHREKDLKLIRSKLLAVLETDPQNATEVKAVVEAGKLLARMHHALQVDKTVQKIKEGEGKKKDTPLTKEQVADLDELIKTG
jgi:hypothetical protein